MTGMEPLLASRFLSIFSRSLSYTGSETHRPSTKHRSDQIVAGKKKLRFKSSPADPVYEGSLEEVESFRWSDLRSPSSPERDLQSGISPKLFLSPLLRSSPFFVCSLLFLNLIPLSAFSLPKPPTPPPLSV